MNASSGDLEISGSAFFRAPDSLALYQEKTALVLKALREVHPYFAKWSTLGKRFLPVQDDLSDLDERIISTVSDANRSVDLIGSKSDGKFGPETLNRIGFSTTYFACKATTLDHEIDSVDKIEIVIRGNSAGAEPHGGIILLIPDALVRDVFSAQDVREVVGKLAYVCDLTVVGASSRGFESAIKQKGDIYSGQWMTYYRMPHLQHCLPRELNSTQLGDGILIETTQSFPDANNPVDVAAGKRVREALDNLGLVWHSIYAIHGWPPDEEEWRYEEFISSAPRGRKYRVRCIDFDGYDAQRDVLLYAKLFRRLRQQRKEWGLRGWDGPVLNEARRQVRAANGTQIEWHVGLEEPASRVRTLLADYTDFNEAQLRVIYTPLHTTLSP